MAVLHVEVVRGLRFQFSILFFETKLLGVDIHGATSTPTSSLDDSESDADALLT